MTAYLIDLASYQDGIDLAAVKAAGFSLVNIKLSQGDWYQWSKASQYIASAKALGLGICTFHWLDNTASGAAQARIVLDLMRRYDVLDGCAHQCDCEDTATLAIWRDYVNAMQDGLGRHIANYTGDWWWQPRGWTGADLTPYLWAGPNSGYLSAYPGDTSSHWTAGYGGWSDYSLLQYAVQPVGTAGGGNLSKTAIRDPAVWTALTGGDDVLDGYDARYRDGVNRSEGLVLKEVWTALNWGQTSNGDGTLLGDLYNQVRALAAGQAESAKREAALLAAMQALTAGGTSIDTAAVLAAVREVGEQESAAIVILQADLDELQRARRAAAQAEAAALADQV